MAKDLKKLPFFTAEMLEAAQNGRLPVQVGVPVQGQGSRRLMTGQKRRQPPIHGGGGNYHGRGA